jgi:predicted AlkP superfamily phosphohydrolase/phosphomutase
MKKVLVIGFDGATFDLIGPFTKKGVLPSFSTVLQQGVSAPMLSVIPPVSAPAWVSMVTGKNPGKHNVYGFVDGKGKVVNSTFRKSKAVWNLLDDHGKRSIIYNVPVTHPPEKINGIILSGIMSPHKKGYYNRFQHDKESFMEREKVFKKMVQSEISKTDKALKILNEEEWDLFFIVYHLSDYVPTLYWKYMDTTHPQYTHHDVLSTAVEDSYRVLDTILGRFLSCVDEDTCVFVVSDHGIGPSTKVFNINEWLRKKGFLTIKTHVALEKAFSFDKVAAFIDNHHIVKRIIKKVPESLQKKGYNLVVKRSKNVVSRMDADSTKAYAYSHAHFASIWSVTDENALKKIEENIKTVKDPDTDEDVIQSVYKRDQIFHGPWVDNAPDLVVKAVPYCSIRSQRIGNLFSEPLQSGDHRMHGIFIAYGCNIRGGPLKEVSIFDVCPTILAALGLPVPSDMDGRVIKEIFEEVNIRKEKKDSQRETYLHVFTEEEEEKIKKRLSALGYFD